MKITLCGSTRFKKEYQEANTRLSLAGHVVYTVAWAKEDEPVKMDRITKENLDLVHLAKILNSDGIVVVGTGEDDKAYIGESTRREIVWAQMNNKMVFWGLDHFFGEMFEEAPTYYNDLTYIQNR